MPTYRDDDITFFMGMYHDLDRARRALGRLREHYPDTRIIVRSDGDKAPENHELAQRFAIEYREEERLFPVGNGGALVARMLELYLERPTRYLLKIDTDTALWRRFHFLPEKSGVFGSLQSLQEVNFSIQGGGVGFSEDAARSILGSGLLKDARLKNPADYQHESEYFACMARRAKRCGLSSFDWIIGWAASKLQIPMFSFTEVCCCWKPEDAVNNDDLRHALTHPVYFEAQAS